MIHLPDMRIIQLQTKRGLAAHGRMIRMNNQPKAEKIRHIVYVPGTTLKYPETAIRGAQSGPKIVVSAGVHSREYVGIEAAQKLAKRIDPENVCGEITIVHAFNYDGLIKRSNDVFPGDGRNLNREFPGDANGSETQRLAAYIEREVTGKADFVIDLHSGGGYENLTPHVYFHGSAAPEVCAQSEQMARYVNVKYIVRSWAENGLYSYAGQMGVPSILIERGECGMWSDEEAEADAADVLNILRMLGALKDGIAPVDRQPRVLDGGCYEDSPESGLWYPKKRVGDTIVKDECVGEIKDIFGEEKTKIYAKCDGVVLYQTASLGIEAGRPMIAYGKL